MFVHAYLFPIREYAWVSEVHVSVCVCVRPALGVRNIQTELLTVKASVHTAAFRELSATQT